MEKARRFRRKSHRMRFAKLRESYGRLIRDGRAMPCRERRRLQGKMVAAAKSSLGEGRKERRLTLPNVLPAWARNRFCGMLLCHRLPTNWTVFTPHIHWPFALQLAAAIRSENSH